MREKREKWRLHPEQTRPWPHTHCARCRCGRKGRSGGGRQPGPRSAHSPAPVTATAQGLHAGTPPGVSCTSLAAGRSALPSALGPSAGSAAGRLPSPAGQGCEKLLPDTQLNTQPAVKVIQLPFPLLVPEAEKLASPAGQRREKLSHSSPFSSVPLHLQGNGERNCYLILSAQPPEKVIITALLQLSVPQLALQQVGFIHLQGKGEWNCLSPSSDFLTSPNLLHKPCMWGKTLSVQELRESRGGRPGLLSLISLWFLWMWIKTSTMKKPPPPLPHDLTSGYVGHFRNQRDIYKAAKVVHKKKKSPCNQSDTLPPTDTTARALLANTLFLSLSRTHTTLSLSLCAVLFFFWEPVKQNNSQHIWQIADFVSGIRWSYPVKYWKLPVNANPVDRNCTASTQSP